MDGATADRRVSVYAPPTPRSCTRHTICARAFAIKQIGRNGGVLGTRRRASQWRKDRLGKRSQQDGGCLKNFLTLG